MSHHRTTAGILFAEVDRPGRGAQPLRPRRNLGDDGRRARRRDGRTRLALRDAGAERRGPDLHGPSLLPPRGRYARRQTGIYSDDLVPGLRRLADAAHRHGAKIFAQVAHAGSQSRIPANEPLAPSPVPNQLTGREVGEASPEEIEEAIDAFAAGARRAVEAGFDGVHIHGANG